MRANDSTVEGHVKSYVNASGRVVRSDARVELSVDGPVRGAHGSDSADAPRPAARRSAWERPERGTARHPLPLQVSGEGLLACDG